MSVLTKAYEPGRRGGGARGAAAPQFQKLSIFSGERLMIRATALAGTKNKNIKKRKTKQGLS